MTFTRQGETYEDGSDDYSWVDRPDALGHAFQPVDEHPDDDECTWREDGTDRTYCGEPEGAHSDE